MKHLNLSADLRLPLDAVTQTIAILAKRRAGKSYTMRRLAEQLFHAGQQIVIVDPKGDQWGIRSAADGKGPGLPVVILGGERGDVPLEPGGGELVAKLVVEERVSILLDISLFRKHEVATFMTAFLENLYRLKAREIYRTPMMLVIDEADAIAPQKPQKGEERMLGAAEDIVRRGGQRGIGCVLVTQRSAVLNKNVLTQAQMLIVLRTIAPQDLAALDAWIDVHGTPEERNTLMESLPSLPIGDAWFWSPGWPTVDGIFKRTRVLPIETFDSGATPKPGEKKIEPKRAADVDLDALKRQMAATIEKAKADDPKELRKQNATLRKELETARAVKPAPAEVQRVEVPVLKDGQIGRLEKIVGRLGAEQVRHQEAMRSIRDELTPQIGVIIGVINSVTMAPKSAPAVSRPPPRKIIPEIIPARTSSGADGEETLTGVEQRILNELAEMRALGLHPVSRPQLAVFCGYTNHRSGGFSEPVGKLLKMALISSSAGMLTLTASGDAIAQEPQGTKTPEDVQQRILSRLDGVQAKILRALIEIYPQPISRADLARQLNYENPRSGGFSEPVGSLIRLGLIGSPVPGQVVARDILFP